MLGNSRSKLALIFGLAIFPGFVFGSQFTPIEWQRVVQHHANRRFVGQHKHLSWVRDRNRNFIDDEIERRFHPGDHLNVIVDFNRCITPAQIKETFGKYGLIAYISKTVSSVYLDEVAFNSLHTLAEDPRVAMIEWQVPFTPEMDVASLAIEAHSSKTYPGLSAQEAGLDGTGVVVAILGTGVSDSNNSSSGFVQLNNKLVAGYDASNPNDPGDGSTDPADVTTHESVMAAMVVGAAAPANITCRQPNDGSTSAHCAGIASGAKYVNIRQCAPTSSGFNCDSSFGAIAMDWIAANAQKFNIKVVNMSFSQSCVSDDGTSSAAQQANYLAAIGVLPVVSAERAWAPNTPGGCPAGFTINVGQQWVTAPGSGSMTLQVTGSDDKGTVSRSDDTVFNEHTSGPRIDFNFANPDVSALKPDIAAPAVNLTTYQRGTTVFTGVGGTSPAAAFVSGAAALLLQKFNSEITPDSLKQLLLTGADSSHNTPYGSTTGPSGNWDSNLGWGILNVGGALQAASGQATDLTFTNCTPTGSTLNSPCNLANGAPNWDNEVDITTTLSPQANTATTVKVTITNRGTKTATNVLVNFGEYDFAAGNPLFYHIGTQVVASIGPGQTVSVPQSWTPSSDSHQCIQVSIAYGLDSDYTNNVTQRNFAVGASLFHVRVENPFFKKTTYKVDARSARAGWVCQVNQKEFTLGPEDCPFDLEVTFDAPAGTPPGASAKCQVGVYATPEEGKTRLLGGVTVRTIVPKPCEMYGQVENEKGEPVAGARVMLSRLDHLEAGSKGANEVSATTNADGVFIIHTTPMILQRLTVEKAGVGKGQMDLRPTCGTSLAGLVLSGNTLEIKYVPPRVVDQNAATNMKAGE